MAGERDEKLKRIALIIMAALVGIILIGTVVGLIFPKQGVAGKQAQSQSAPEYITIFTGDRFPSTGPKTVTAVFSMALSLPANDGSFREEVMARKEDIRAGARNLLAGKSPDAMREETLSSLKASLSDMVNGMLLLGQVEVLITDFQLID